MNTEEQDKELLLEDLCARLPYFPMLQIDEDGHKHDEPLYSCVSISQWEWTINDEYILEYLRPYLRPMSSMTEEEDSVYEQMLKDVHYKPRTSTSLKLIDWLNAHHFDYRGLIEKGLALEAPEGMYDLKN